MATPRRRRRSVAEIEALANKPTKAKRALPKSRALKKPMAVPKAVRAKIAQRSLEAAMKEIKELAATKRRAALVGSGARTYLPKEVKSRIDGTAKKVRPARAKPAVRRIEALANMPTRTKSPGVFGRTVPKRGVPRRRR